MTPQGTLIERPYYEKPYWHIERARMGNTREVPVELVVNGRAVARKNIVADGKVQEVEFDTPIQQSSWLAVRILGSSHSNPIFAVVDGKLCGGRDPGQRAEPLLLVGIVPVSHHGEDFLLLLEEEFQAGAAHLAIPEKDDLHQPTLPCGWTYLGDGAEDAAASGSPAHS